MTAHLHRISAAEYHAETFLERPALSSSIATTLVTQSPLHAWAQHPKLGGTKGSGHTKAKDGGTLFHELVLGEGKGIVVIDAGDYKTKAAQADRDAAHAAGLTPVLRGAFEEASVAAAKIRARFEDLGIVFDGESEIAITWEVETALGPVLCRGLMDHLREVDGIIYDLKSTRDAHPREFGKSCVTYGYDIQHAAYVQAVEQLRPELAGRVQFKFLCAELDEPHAVMVGTPKGGLRELGQRRWRRAVETWAGCLVANAWPGYGAQDVDAPRWAILQDEEREGA